MSNSGKPNASWIAIGLKNDFMPSVVVFLVALPLCLGIAIASGAPPVAGLITGIVGGLVVGWIAGSPLQVSGPAAGLTVIVYDLFQKYEIETVMLVICIAGLIQVAAGLLKLGQWFRAVSPAVIQGMLAGIGVLIFSSQFHIMADDPPRSALTLFGAELHGGLANLLTIPETIYHIFTPANRTHQWAAGLGVLTITIIVGWQLLARGRMKLIPGPLLGVVAATLITLALGLPIEQLEKLLPESLAAGLTLPNLALWSEAPLGSLLLPAVGLALIASAETLLCATAVDGMHQGQRTRYDRELFAQGVGNTICGLVGGLPMTGVIVRSSANVQAGAKTRMSAIMHGLWLLLLVALVPFVLAHIPISSLAAVLVYIGYKLVNPAAIKKLWQAGKSEVAIYAVTVVMIVSTDLLTGVLTGVALAALKLLYTFSHLGIDHEAAPDQRQTTLRLEGAATFLRLPKLAGTLEKVPGNTELHVDLQALDYIDHACLELLINWEKQHEASGGSLVIDWDSLHAKFKSDRNGSFRRGPSFAVQAGNGSGPEGQRQADPELAPAGKTPQ